MKKFLSLILLLAVITSVGSAGAQAEWISLGTGVPLEHPDLPDHQLTSAGREGDWSARPWPL